MDMAAISVSDEVGLRGYPCCIYGHHSDDVGQVKV
jgi:hypothetical protein